MKFHCRYGGRRTKCRLGSEGIREGEIVHARARRGGGGGGWTFGEGVSVRRCHRGGGWEQQWQSGGRDRVGYGGAG